MQTCNYSAIQPSHDFASQLPLGYTEQVYCHVCEMLQIHLPPDCLVLQAREVVPLTEPPSHWLVFTEGFTLQPPQGEGGNGWAGQAGGMGTSASRGSGASSWHCPELELPLRGQQRAWFSEFTRDERRQENWLDPAAEHSYSNCSAE